MDRTIHDFGKDGAITYTSVELELFLLLSDFTPWKCLESLFLLLLLDISSVFPAVWFVPPARLLYVSPKFGAAVNTVLPKPSLCFSVISTA